MSEAAKRRSERKLDAVSAAAKRRSERKSDAVSEADQPEGDDSPPQQRGLRGALQTLDGPDSVRDTVLQAIGGVRGIVDSSLPTTVFVIALAIGGLRPAVAAALVSGVVLALVRLARRESLQQTVTGLVGVALAALVAVKLHSSAAFFLPGILLDVLYAGLAVASVLARRPFIGYIAAVVEPRLSAWRSLPKVRRAAALASLIWAAMFAARAGVQGSLYLAHRTGLLATAKLAMGWPLWGIAVGSSYVLLRRALAALPAPIAPPVQEAPSTLPS